MIFRQDDRRLRLGWPCYDGVNNATIMGAVCQDLSKHVYCLRVEDSRDRFCMKYNIPEGASCGATVGIGEACGATAAEVTLIIFFNG